MQHIDKIIWNTSTLIIFYLKSIIFKKILIPLVHVYKRSKVNPVQHWNSQEETNPSPSKSPEFFAAKALSRISHGASRATHNSKSCDCLNSRELSVSP